MNTPDPATVRTRRLRSQRLDWRARLVPADAAAVVRDTAGLQAQDERAAMLGVRVRSSGLRTGHITTAMDADRTIVRAWCMRGTLHLVAATHLRDLLAVFGPVFIHRGRRRLAQLGLDDDACARAMPRIHELLADGRPRTRTEIAAAVRGPDVPVHTDGQAPFHLVRRACLAGIAVEAGAEARAPVYTMLNRWLPGEPVGDRDGALARVVRGYRAAHGPAGREDFAAWSGLPASDVSQAWDRGATPTGDDEIPRAESPGRPTGHDGTAEPAAGAVRFLPAFDGWFLGYRTREHAIDDAHWPAVHPGGGILRPTVLVDGTAVATWRLDQARRPARVVVTPFPGLTPPPTDALSAEAADVGRFLGLDAALEVLAT